MTDEKPAFEGWAILELMGHRRLGGYVSEATVAGAGFLRIDVPGDDGGADPDSMVATQFYSPSSVYCLTPVTEEMARAVAARNRPQPVQRWELPAVAKATTTAAETCGECDEMPCSACGGPSLHDICSCHEAVA